MRKWQREYEIASSARRAAAAVVVADSRLFRFLGGPGRLTGPRTEYAEAVGAAAVAVGVALAQLLQGAMMGQQTCS